MKANITTIIMHPTWGQTMKLLEEKKTVRISTKDAQVFQTILDAAGYKYETKEDGKDLTRFTLTSQQKKDEHNS